MESVYLKELKSFSISEVMNFRQKYEELLNKIASKEANSEDRVNDDPKSELRLLTTKEKIERKRSKMDKISSHDRKKAKKELPAFLPPVVCTGNSDCNEETSDYDLVPGKDVVFLFQIYPPFQYNPMVRTPKVRHSLEIAILGNQPLNLLCDKIMCTDNYMEVGGDISETPDTPVRQRLGEKYKSRMLYIGNTFYIDKSDEKNIDYSEPIKRWGQRNNLEFGETQDMHKVTCLDLIARIGYPYVYQHLGGCEHVLRILYARLIEDKDCLESKYYPFCHHIARNNRQKLCMACMELAQWIVFDSPRMIANPSFLCNNCFRSYHYIDGKKIGSFSAVRFWDCPVFDSTLGEINTKEPTVN